jgi:23S rRNA pseudoU1915 N3-methylase RlmH
LQAVEDAIDAYAERLAKNALIGGVDVTREPEDRFKRFARVFEKNNTRLLRVVSPSEWIY